MQIIQTVAELKTVVANRQKNKEKIGFVPTMGALHQGHIELVKRAVAENDVCVVSIFVNPTQFNDKNDLVNYPRTLDADCRLLEQANVAYVFAPSVEEIYPQPDTRQFDFGTLATVMEGKFRPGHFNGVAQVVSRLFDIVTPDKAYFGEKDFQQLAIIRELVRQLKLNVEIVACPIVRAESGLALSSRNARLSYEQKRNAAQISQALFLSKQLFRLLYPIETLKAMVRQKLQIYHDFKVEYFEIVDGYSLQTLTTWEDSDYAVGCIAVYVGEVRLIDNITYCHEDK